MTDIGTRTESETRYRQSGKPPELMGCAVCGAVGFGQPPHGWEQPCPQKLKLDEAYIAATDAQRMASLRQANAAEGMLEGTRRALGLDDDEDV